MKIKTLATLLILFSISLTALLSACKGDDDNPTFKEEEFQATIGTNNSPLTIKLTEQVTNLTLKNLPRSADPTALTATLTLPSGYTISPDPKTARNYSTQQVFTITRPDGFTYTLNIIATAYDAVTNPYGVYTVKDLNEVRLGYADSYILINDITMPDLSALGVSQSGISDYALYGWFPLGNRYQFPGSANIPFEGSFDGQNFTIKNFTSKFRASDVSNPDGIDAGKSNLNAFGLFGLTNSATIKNLNLQLGAAGMIGSSVDEKEQYSNFGALVGWAKNSTISNCSVSGTSKIQEGGQDVGGLVGFMDEGTIENCFSNITPSSGMYALDNKSSVGGLIGRTLRAKVSKCYSTTSIKGSTYLGGLIGRANGGSIEKSYATGHVLEFGTTATGLTSPSIIGGLIGDIRSQQEFPLTITDCYARGSVKGTEDTPVNEELHKNTRIGSLIGESSNVSNEGTTLVKSCYATGAVSRKYTKTGNETFIGGIVGSTGNGIYRAAGSSTVFWDKTTTGQNFLGGGDPSVYADNGFAANGKTTAEMKQQSTYAGWDFITVWSIDAAKNDGYPTLR